jgi:hypothetical protein
VGRPAGGDGLSTDVAFANALVAVAVDEASARRIVVEYQPLDRSEAIGKLVYISAFLIVTQLSLEEAELSRILSSVEGSTSST